MPPSLPSCPGQNQPKPQAPSPKPKPKPRPKPQADPTNPTQPSSTQTQPQQSQMYAKQSKAKQYKQASPPPVCARVGCEGVSGAGHFQERKQRPMQTKEPTANGLAKNPPKRCLQSTPLDGPKSKTCIDRASGGGRGKQGGKGRKKKKRRSNAVLYSTPIMRVFSRAAVMGFSLDGSEKFPWYTCAAAPL